MGEVVQIHVGQAGVQIANACWELYCLEHGITADGTLTEQSSDQTFRNFFSYKDACRVVPRTVLIDSEPTVIDQIRTGPYGRLYNPALLVTGKEDSGSNFARGYYTIGAEMIDITMDAIRSVAESCCNLRGFLIFRAIGGGTGSGLGNLIADLLKDQYDKVTKIEFVIFPSPSISPLIVEPYNALLATHLGMESIECSFILDNEALYDICAANLNICSPKYKNLNRIIGQTVSTFTTSQRFLGESNVSFAEFQTNLVPYPRIHFPLVSYAPFIPGTGLGYSNFSTEQITNACFDPCSQLVRCNPIEGKYMSCVLLYRGKVSTSYINYSLMQLKRSNVVRFVDWQPSGFKVGISSEPPFTVPCGGLSNSNKALLTLSNNTIIHKTWCRLMAKYNRLFSRRAFIHHFIEEGLEEDALKEASEDICALIGDYLEVDNASSTSDMPVTKRNEITTPTAKIKVEPTECSRPDRNVVSFGNRRAEESRSSFKEYGDKSRQPDSGKNLCVMCGGCSQRTCPIRLRNLAPTPRTPLPSSSSAISSSSEEEITHYDEESCHSRGANGNTMNKLTCTCKCGKVVQLPSRGNCSSDK